MSSLPAVHPLQPRFAQAITGVLALEAMAFDQPAALAVGADGRLCAARAGRVGAPEIAQVLAAL